jgi:type III pantothenate kinase
VSDLVAVTLGNSSAALARVADGRLGEVRRVSIDRLDDLGGALAAAGKGATVIVASVNPPALARLATLAAGRGAGALRVAGTGFPIPLRTDVTEPERVGTDRLLGALAAWRRAGGACVTVDAGTAITVNAVRADGVFLGGAILPGPDLMARALADGTAQLPPVGLPDDAPPVGRSTEEAIAAGVLIGAAGAVAALVAQMRRTVGPGAPVLVTGGGAARIVAHLPADCRRIVPDLVLEGLVAAYREHEKR